jgi:ParB family chromosome partitioning protein
VFEEESLEELAQSIRELGIIQPITVKKIRANKFLIISGERRFRASQLAGLDAIPAYVREANDEQVMQMALVENLQRQDLHAIEMANSLSRLIEEFSLTQEELGKKIGKSRASISNSLRLLRLPGYIQDAIIHREISEGHAKALVSIEDVEWQRQVFDLIGPENLSVRQVEELAKSQHWQEGPVVIPEKKARKAPMNRSESRANDLLVHQFGKSVKLRAKGNGEGKIELIYKDEEELKGWLESLGI